MGNLGALGYEASGADTARNPIRNSSLPAAPEDIWGRPLPEQETEDDEVDRLLLAINWLCDMLEHMNRAPGATCPDAAPYDELMRRLQHGSRSALVRDCLDLAARRVEAGCYGEAVSALRGMAG